MPIVERLEQPRLARLGLRLRIGLFFALLAVGAIAAMIFGAWTAITQSDYVYIWEVPGLFESKMQGWLFAAFLILVLVGGIWHVFDTQFVRAIERLSVTIRARAHADVRGDFTDDHNAAPFLGDLGPAAAELSRSLAASRAALSESVARETSRLTSEKALLETLIADVPVGVVLCSGDFDLVFYNGPALAALGAAGTPALGRNLLDYLRPGPLRDAYARLSAVVDPEATSEIICATINGARLMSARMRVLRRSDPDRAPGFVLTLRDLTSDLASHAAREMLLAETFERLRPPATALQAAAELVAEDPSLAGEPVLNDAVLADIRHLGRAMTDLAARHDAHQPVWRPFAELRAQDLMDGIGAQFAERGLVLEIDAPDLMLNCDGFELALMLRWLGQRLSAEGYGQGFTLRLTEEDGPGAVLDLIWQGPVLPIGVFETWLREGIDPNLPDLTARAVLQAHGTEAWTERGPDGAQLIRLPIPRARRATRRPTPLSRDVVYDFELLSKDPAASVLDTPLEDLTFVVFDTETTGLDPALDEVVQLAAVRIVNGRRLRGEVFETLVDPACAIPEASSAVHGITDDMVKGAPSIVEAGRQFHDFVRGAVLVAHNAPFDMEFLRRYEVAMQRRFDHPIVDTLLLSAIVFGSNETHSLDALAVRLGITVSDEERHTAMGDTIATADAFLRLIPILKARRFVTFGDLLVEMRRHGTLLADPNSEFSKHCARSE